MVNYREIASKSVEALEEELTARRRELFDDARKMRTARERGSSVGEAPDDLLNPTAPPAPDPFMEGFTHDDAFSEDAVRKALGLNEWRKSNR